MYSWYSRNFTIDADSNQFSHLQTAETKYKHGQELIDFKNEQNFFEDASGYYIAFGCRTSLEEEDWIRLVFSVHKSAFLDLVSFRSECHIPILNDARMSLAFGFFLFHWFATLFPQQKAHVRFRDSGKAQTFRRPEFLRFLTTYLQIFNYKSVMVDGNKTYDNFNMFAHAKVKYMFVIYPDTNSHANSFSAARELYSAPVEYRIQRAKLQHFLIQHNIQEDSYEMSQATFFFRVLTEKERIQLANLYQQWLFALGRYVQDAGNGNDALHRLIARLKAREIDSARLTFYSHALVEFAMLFLSDLFPSKFKMLQANIFLWRIQHLFSLLR